MLTNHIKIYYQNVRGLISNAVEVRQQILNNTYDVYIFTETWLNSGFFDSELFEKNYVVYRRDRETSSSCAVKGGGVLIAVSTQLVSKREIEWESECEDLWVTITTASASIQPGKSPTTLRLCAVYLPPPVTKNSLKIFLNKANQILESSNDYRHTLIAGDFNMSGITWLPNNSEHLNSVEPSGYANREILCKFVDFLTLHDLKQFNSVFNSQNKILDLILCNQGVLEISECKNPIRKIDKFHPALNIKMNIIKDINTTSNFSRPNFYKADYNSIRDYLSTISWVNEFSSCNNVNDMVTKFYDVLHEAIRLHVPMTASRSGSYPVWYSPHLIYLMRQKSKYHKKIKKYKNPLDEIEFEYLRIDCNRLIKECYNKYIAEIENELLRNPKKFWTYVKNLRHNSSSIPNTMTLSKNTSSDSEIITNMFATHFSSVYEEDNGGDQNNEYNFTPLNEPLDIIAEIQFTSEEVEKKLKKLDIRKGTGPDNIHPLFLVNCADCLAHPLMVLFNRSLQESIFPDKWKEARVVPLFKNGNRKCVTNYRPISILSAISKLFESMVHTVMYSHIKKHITIKQHGFMAKRSCITNLVLFTSDIKESVDQNTQVDVIYTDFSKAFDKVNHNFLVKKLNALGVTDIFLEWCKSYLTNRFSRVVVHGKQSRPFTASSGIPQGSILGPLFFNVYINDITNVVKHSRVYLFADDLKLLKPILNTSDAKYLQDDINNIHEWCIKNKMYLNSSKCHHIKFTRKRNKLQTSYFIASNKLEEVTSIRDLGVLMDSKLGFSEHIDKITTDAYKSLGFILRCTRGFKKPAAIIQLYNSYVRNKVEYGSTVWYPNYKCHINRIERVQKKFVRILSYRFKVPRTVLTYKDRLRYFNLQELSARRSHLDLIFLYKLINGVIDCPSLLERLKYNVPTRIPRKPCSLFYVKRCRTNLGSNTPMVRVSRLYNKLTINNLHLDVHHDSYSTFSAKLKKLTNF